MPSTQRSKPSFLARPALALTSVWFLCAGCGTQSNSVSDDVRRLVDHGHFEEAVRKSADAAADAPGNAELEALHREATVALLLERGRRLTFDDQDEEALTLFEKAVATLPESKEAGDWLAKTKRKLAERWMNMALELHAKDEIEAALAAYESSLKYAPADKDALTGRDLALLILSHRAGLGRTYFDDGLHALADYWLEQARSRFTYARKYQPTDTRTNERKGQVETLLSVQRIALGRQAEEDRHFGAAHSEYRHALALDPNSQDAKDGIARSKIELEVNALLVRASMDIVRGRFDNATKIVEEALGKTVAQKDMCEGKLAAIREARFEKAYREALSLERDDRFEEAVVAYTELLAKSEFYKDVITRKDTLEEYIRLAGDLYTRAQTEADPKAKLALLQQIQVFWPEYKDVVNQVKALTPPPAPGS